MKKELTRNEFIKQCGMICMGTVAGSSVLTSCGSSNHFATATVKENNVVVKSSEFIYQGKSEVKQRPFVLVKVAQLEFPIGLYRFSDTNYKALYLQCTHQGCEVQPYTEYLVCPCHGSEFSNEGKVMQSPAESDLKQFAVSLDNDNIIIHL